MFLEEFHACNEDQGEEVKCHQQVISHCSSCFDLPYIKFCCQSCKVHATSDIGTGHDRCHTCKSWNKVVKQGICKKCTGNSSGRTDTEDDHDPSGFFPDLLHVALKHQQRNTHGNCKAPDNVIIQGTGGRNNGQVGKNQSK